MSDMYRSFAALRMTTPRGYVILSAAKDLYEMSMKDIIQMKHRLSSKRQSIISYERYLL